MFRLRSCPSSPSQGGSVRFSRGNQPSHLQSNRHLSRSIAQKPARMDGPSAPTPTLAPFHTDQVFIDPDDVTRFDTEFTKPVQLIQRGEVVAFPTETVYGLGANALDGQAVKKIFAAKNRPADNPLIVHIASERMLDSLIRPGAITPLARTLMDRFWPGPLTLLFEKGPGVPEEVTAGQPTVAVRMPSHPVAKRLIELSNLPIAAPSANLSGKPSPTAAEHVLTDLAGRIPCVIDGGPCDIGLESTVIDIHRNPPLILRPGGVTLEQLRQVVPSVQVYSKAIDATGEMEAKPATPGLKYRHYSPQGHLTLVTGPLDKVRQYIEEQSKAAADSGQLVGVVETHRASAEDSTYSQELHTNSKLTFVALGDGKSPLQIARGLFKTLRLFDQKGVNSIFMEGISEDAEGLAVMNRARKAASTVVELSK